MLVLAGTLAFVVTHRDVDGHAARPGKDRGRPSKEGFREEGRSGPWLQDSQAGALRPTSPGKPGGSRSNSDRHLAGTQPKLRSDLKVQVKPGHPRQQELEASAGRVEAYALRHLDQLTHDLDLTAEQQTRIFPILVRGAQSYDPGMQIVDGRGSNGTSTPLSDDTAAAEPLEPERQQELIQEELDPGQADALVNLSIRDLMIWEELIDDLTRQLDQATPGQVAEVTPATLTPPPAVDPAPTSGSTGEIAPTTPAAETPAADSAPPQSSGGRNLFDLIPAE